MFYEDSGEMFFHFYYLYERFFLEIIWINRISKPASMVLPKIVAVPAAALAPVSAFASCNFYIEMLMTLNNKNKIKILRKDVEVFFPIGRIRSLRRVN
jgi:hypothetical protein